MKYYKLTLIILTFLFMKTQVAYAQNFLSGFIKVESGKLYYEIAGAGDNIILIHDGLVHHEVWDAQFVFFSQNYSVIRYDRRGYGKSPISDTAFSSEEDLYKVFLQLKIESAILFGISAGGALAIDFTLKYPKKVRAMVLAGAVVSGYPITPYTFSRGGRINLNDIINDQEKMIQYFGWDDPYEVYPGNIKAKERLLELLKKYPENVDLISKRKFEKKPEREAFGNLAEIKVPVLILTGEFDIPDVHAHAGVIEAGIENSKRAIVMKSGHLIPLEQPEIFNELSLEFLKKLK